MNCPNCKTGKLEASTKIYLDVDEATVDENGDATLEAVSFSYLNDELDGKPANFESELYVSCDHCGVEVNAYLGEKLRERIGPQPIGGAPREVGQRGGR